MDLPDFFVDAARKHGCGPVRASFHPYVELKHTWCRREGILEFKISDYLKDAPSETLRGLAEYLVSRAAGFKPSSAEVEVYDRYVRSKVFWMGKKNLYLSRSRSISTDPIGKYRDLRVVFDYVNSNYFRGQLTTPTLAWVKESPKVRLGYYFEQLDLLAANRVLDAASIPRYVLEFVIYHELLHYVDASNGRPRRRVHHTKEFRAQERRFSSFEDSEKWLKRLANKRPLK